jgi:hypothetical protein
LSSRHLYGFQPFTSRKYREIAQGTHSIGRSNASGNGIGALRHLAGLDSRYRGSQRRTRTAQTEARILEATRQGPRDGTTHWSSWLAKELGISQSSVSRVWRHFGIQPHRVRRYMASDDPEFEEKAADIIGLYLKPPVNAAVFCVDEKSAIQALSIFLKTCHYYLRDTRLGPKIKNTGQRRRALITAPPQRRIFLALARRREYETCDSGP